jgi:hypothetical protein
VRLTISVNPAVANNESARQLMKKEKLRELAVVLFKKGPRKRLNRLDHQGKREGKAESDRQKNPPPVHCPRKRLAEIPSGILSLPLGNGKVVQCFQH